VLIVSYLFRDRETKLRIYPGISPMLVLPIVLLVQDRGAVSFAALFPFSSAAAIWASSRCSP